MDFSKHKVIINGSILESDELNFRGEYIHSFQLDSSIIERKVIEAELVDFQKKLSKLNLNFPTDIDALLKDTIKLIEVNGKVEEPVKYVFNAGEDFRDIYIFYKSKEYPIFDREISLIGMQAFQKLINSSVMVVGLGGVGSSACEFLARAGVGRIVICDFDYINPSNINRQIIALNSTLRRKKTSVMADRIFDINPDCKVETIDLMITKENVGLIKNYSVDYIVDAIDMFDSKLSLIHCAKSNNLPIISSMGTGNKLNPLDFKVADIYSTKNCPLARKLRKELRAFEIKELKVVYSEEAQKPKHRPRGTIGSISFVPPVSGLVMVSEVVKDLISKS